MDAVRAEIQLSQTSLAQLCKELGINPKTVPKWRISVTVEDLEIGPKGPRSTVLTEAEEVTIHSDGARWMIASMLFRHRFRI